MARTKLSSKDFLAELAELSASLRRTIEAEDVGFDPSAAAIAERRGLVADPVTGFEYFVQHYFPHYVRHAARSELHNYLYKRLNTLAMSTLDVTAVESQPGRTEQENALLNGLTPFEIGPGDKVQIVRAISTYTKNAQGVDDVALLDITTSRTLDYVRKACRERIALRFPRDKLSSRTPPKVRSELLDVLYKLEELEIVEEVDANKDGLIVERDLQDVNQLNGRIPADVVNGLHVFAGRIDLLL